jgi:hypothetical protein
MVMMNKIDLSGIWNLQLDEEKQGVQYPYRDTILLPGTTSYAKKGRKNEKAELGCLTDEYKFIGYAWYSREIEFSFEMEEKISFLYLERTRVTRVWIDDEEVGTQNSLCTPHIYDITKYIKAGKHTITILVDNSDYPTRGGHLTSQDTQTNWNGITGRMEIQIYHSQYIKELQVYPDIKNKCIQVKASISEGNQGVLSLTAESFNGAAKHNVAELIVPITANELSFTYCIGDEMLLWSEYEPNLYRLKCELKIEDHVIDTKELTFGMKEFKAAEDKFLINGKKTFLRGKHDGLIFPLTGFAPTSLEEWLKVLTISKSYGINHYRFHTCCPPEAAFEAADILGIYMEPELPFWGTVTDDNDDNHNPVEQNYLIAEGFRMLKHYGNHPSFAMLSLGNELWGSKSKLNSILKAYKEYDSRHLYTQGSNNFQFFPEILEEEDFFCGVRFSKHRLFRGSYAMCDAPLGHVQTDRPNTRKDYDTNIYPVNDTQEVSSSRNSDGTIEIQFGTEAKKVTASEQNVQIIPHIPVVSHEIGQYATFPNYNEINKYTGSLKARNLEAFYKRLEEKGLAHLAEKYFINSGKLAVQCYKEELEAALRSKKLAGFQILDLQDFSGQGTALVGILDAFMDSKGIISAEEWRSFCSDAVLMARFDKYNYLSGDKFSAHMELCYYRNIPLHDITLLWELKDDEKTYEKGIVKTTCSDSRNYYDLCDISINMPKVTEMKKLSLSMRIEHTDIAKDYELWVYPTEVILDSGELILCDSFSEKAIANLEAGKKVVILPNPERFENTIEGFYCTDFWCYPMFRSISESMNKKVPVGTMGLLNDVKHPVFKDFPCEEYSTYPWWSIVTNSRSVILDGTSKNLQPMVQIIDNFERNHKLGLLFECKVLQGKLLVCTCDFDKIMDQPEARQFLYSIFNYAKSDDFSPECELSLSEVTKLLQ